MNENELLPVPPQQEIEKVIQLAEQCEELLEQLPGEGIHFYDCNGNEIGTVSRFEAICETIRWMKGEWKSPPLTEDNVTELQKYLGEKREAEFQAVIGLLAKRYPGTVEYNARDDDRFDLLDEHDQVVATITEREMTATWNVVELSR